MARSRIDIEITDNAFSLGPNRWRYAWRRVVLEQSGHWVEDTRCPLSSESPGYGYAYNTLETNNTATGIQGSGDDLNELDPAFQLTIKPIGLGAVIPNAFVFETGTGALEVLFSVPNNVTGADCPNDPNT